MGSRLCRVVLCVSQRGERESRGLKIRRGKSRGYTRESNAPHRSARKKRRIRAGGRQAASRG